MPLRPRSGPKGTRPLPRFHDDQAPREDLGESATSDNGAAFETWSNQVPMEKVLETITNTDSDRFKTPSPKLPTKAVSPPKVQSRKSRNKHRHSTYSIDIEIPAEEAQRIRESSRENGIILFEHFTQKYVAQDRISPGNSPASRNARQVLDPPFLGAPLDLSASHMVQGKAHIIPQDIARSESKATAGTYDSIQTNGASRAPRFD